MFIACGVGKEYNRKAKWGCLSCGEIKRTAFAEINIFCLQLLSHMKI